MDFKKKKKKKGINYKKRIKKCKMLGALKFQGFVFKIDDIKWKLLKKVCPNFIKYCDKYCDFKTRKRLKNIHSTTVKEQIENENYINKILIRKEFNKSQSRNYHIDKNNPNEFMEYLELNKRIHVFGLKANLINLPLIAVAGTIGAPTVLLLGVDLLSMFINFQCINIQNYNINRLKDYQQKLQRKTLEHRGNITREQEYQIKQQRRKNDFQQNYGKAADLIYHSIKKKDGIPTMNEIIDNIENMEQLSQLKSLVDQTLNNRREDSAPIKQKTRPTRKNAI